MQTYCVPNFTVALVSVFYLKLSSSSQPLCARHHKTIRFDSMLAESNYDQFELRASSDATAVALSLPASNVHLRPYLAAAATARAQAQISQSSVRLAAISEEFVRSFVRTILCCITLSLKERNSNCVLVAQDEHFICIRSQIDQINSSLDLRSHVVGASVLPVE